MGIYSGCLSHNCRGLRLGHSLLVRACPVFYNMFPNTPDIYHVVPVAFSKGHNNNKLSPNIFRHSVGSKIS